MLCMSYTHVIPQLWITRIPALAPNRPALATELSTVVDNYLHKVGINPYAWSTLYPQLFHLLLWIKQGWH